VAGRSDQSPDGLAVFELSSLKHDRSAAAV